MEDLGAPSSYVLLEQGAPVYSCDGRRVGRVGAVLAEEDADIFEAIVVSPGALEREFRIAAELVEEIFERGVLLKIDADGVSALR